ncbi:glutathione s-transferase domain-containing protein [Stylonychia lemnae]|uniref:Glutathione s-transferase domain-containing protein n=1 Tax=Stylonychia lemnae TaxID=5949 RepID=A0A078A1K1_STYLE|nr:glutathione s-transferase domain-containing protein [Stylonychia lemnae]|eukprot:CDW75323.1 glutathione s-transferase domain-containing protein [Stylonychia lemnae]
MSSTKKLIIYNDPNSAPCRAVVSFCKLNNIPFELVETSVAKMQVFQPEFKKINPIQQIPAIKEIDTQTGEEWTLGESHAILRYLINTRQLPDHWYPKEPRLRAKVDQYLDWHHTFLRQGSSIFVFMKLFAPKLFQKTLPEEQLKFQFTYLTRSLSLMERWLAQSKYLCGEQMTIADISAACELIQTKFIAFDLAKWPKVQAWLKHMVEENPTILEVHQPFLKFASELTGQAKL